jgi:hypothetical protein
VRVYVLIGELTSGVGKHRQLGETAYRVQPLGCRFPEQRKLKLELYTPFRHDAYIFPTEFVRASGMGISVYRFEASAEF